MDFDSFVLAAATGDLSEEAVAREHADIVEFRMDFADDPLSAIDTYAGDLPLLVTNRVEWEGGDAADTADRIDALERAVEYDFVEAVDVELGALDETDRSLHDANRVVDEARTHDVSVVVSVHDFETTPDRSRLETLLIRACEHGDIGKAAITANDPADVLDLLTVTHTLTRQGHRVATMAMGEAGRHSRAIAPLYGSRIGYAPVRPENATAPGQYALETLRTLVSRLESKG